METFQEPLPLHQWLVSAFFRLHRRRQLGQNGYQPLSYQEMADYAERVAKVHPNQLELFYMTIEETDNGVLYDQYMKSKDHAERMEAERAAAPKSRKRK